MRSVRSMVPPRTHQKRALAAYWIRRRQAPTRRSLINHYRLSLYPRARKAGPKFPSIRPSGPNLPRVAWWA
jgi:hypothetical protein